jgi:hypothetical protein
MTKPAQANRSGLSVRPCGADFEAQSQACFKMGEIVQFITTKRLGAAFLMSSIPALGLLAAVLEKGLA